MLRHKHVNEMFGFLWITLTANSQKFVPFLTQASHASQNEWKARRLCEKAPVFVLTWVTLVFHRAGTLENFCTRLDSFLMEGWQCGVKVNRKKLARGVYKFDIWFLFSTANYCFFICNEANGSSRAFDDVSCVIVI